MPQSSITNLFKETYGSTLRATITTNTPMTNAKRSITNKTKERQPRFEGKIGVIVSPLLDLPDTASGPDNNNVRYYATASTHVFTSAVIHASSKTGGPASLLLQNKSWVSSVSAEIIGPGGASCESSLKLGEIRHVFDEKPEMFPVGFSHDVSLVEVPEHVLLGLLPLRVSSSGDGEKGGGGSGSVDWTMTWLDQNEWMNIKYNTTGGLALMDGGSGGKEAKSIGVVDSRCQMVGQGIFRIQQQHLPQPSRRHAFFSSSSPTTPDARSELSTWTSLVARSILYRVREDSVPGRPATRGGQSGTPLCVLDKSTRIAKVAGFTSFAQMVSDVQRYDMEGDKLYKRLQEGRVAFYGAFQVPRELREGYRIV